MNFNPYDLLKSAQQIQEKMGEMQGKLSQIAATGSAGGGMVKITINGQFDVLSVAIEKEVVDPNDVSMLQDLIRAAMSDAMAKVKEDIRTQMTGLTGGLDLPPGFMGM